MHPNVDLHRRFWKGQGPSLIFIPPPEGDSYTLDDYPRRFRDPEVMWRSEYDRARRVAEWPTDGIPAIRPNLGVVFVPSMAGLTYQIKPDQMPWPGAPISRKRIRAARRLDVTQAELMRRAEAFYHIHRRTGNDEVVPYHADTQGVFDVAHLLYGDETFCDLADEGEARWIEELMEICSDLYVRAAQHLKKLLGEPASEMIHGHGSMQGLYFPHAGVRMSEDTATLLSPGMVRRVILPAIERAAQPFGGAFIHYCGRHAAFLEDLSRSECVRAIDLGNPEYYDSRWVLERCAEGGKVYWARIAPASDDEAWEPYTRRVAGLVRETGARVVLRPWVYPKTREESRDMLDLWHHLTG